MSYSDSSSNSGRKSTRGRRSSRRTLTIVCTILSLVLVSAVVFIQGSVSGTEFAPSHFETRRFSFYEIPFLHIQITPISRTLATDATSRQLRTRSLITVPRGVKPTEWHLVTISRGPTGTPAAASLLTEELKISDSGGTFWRGWNQKHPKRAAILWPVVQRLAGRELYVLIPELMQIARSLPGDDDGPALDNEINRWLVGQYAGLIQDLRDGGRDVLAQQLLDEALNDYPGADLLLNLKKS